MFVGLSKKLSMELPLSERSKASITGLETLVKKIEGKHFLRWLGRKQCVGFTPLHELPYSVNPFRSKGIHIFYKPEFLNYGGSGKGRPVSFMLYYYSKIGILKDIRTITTAGFGNFIRTLSELLPLISQTITPKAHMGKTLIEENPDLVNHLRAKGTLIDGCDDGYCPTGDMNRGKAISKAFIEDQTDPTTLMLDQHGVFKPFDGLLNSAGYYHSLVPEIVYQTSGLRNLYYVNGQGTRGSLLGTSTGLKKAVPGIKIVGLRQQEGGHIFGLRSEKQLGKSISLDGAEKLCDNIYTVSDYEAYSTMIRLWKIGIPATPSGGSYIAGALRLAKTMKKRVNIITMVFDSLDFYKTLLRTWIPKILDTELDIELFNSLQVKASQQRTTHIRTLKQGENKLFTTMIKDRFPNTISSESSKQIKMSVS